MKPTTVLPDDPALPGLAAIRAHGLARAIPALGLEGSPVEVLLRAYKPGERATLEVRALGRHLAIKAYADDPAPEVELYHAFADAGLASEAGARVPPLVAWDRELRVLVIGWLEGRPLNQLVKEGQGERTGELAASWIRRVASLSLKLGPRCGVGYALYHAGRAVTGLAAVDPALGSAAKALAGKLARAQPEDHDPRLVHGTLYDRHLLDLGDGPGVIDWQRAGQGPLEFDAGMFLATLWRSGSHGPDGAAEAARAERVFLARTAGLLDEAALAWHRAAALLRLAGKANLMSRRKPDWRARASALLAEAERLAERVGQSGSGRRTESEAGAALKGSPLELVLQALSSTLNGAALDFALRALSPRPATPEELVQMRKLLAEVRKRRP